MRRGAIIGLGNVALHGHLPGWVRRHDVEIVAATDVRPARRVECETYLPKARWYDSATELLESATLDFVDICTPPSSHAPAIRSALRRGLHVLCEKPLVGSLDELDSIAALASAGGQVVYTVHNWHHAPIVRLIHDLVRQGKIGQLTHVAWHTLRTKPAESADANGKNWRVDPAVAGGGVLTDHGWHVFYLVHGWINEPPISLAARLETRKHVGWPVEDTATVQLTFPNARAEIFLTWASDVRRNSAELVGTEGTITVHDDTILLTQHTDRQTRRWVCPPALSDGSHHPDWFAAVATQFLEALTGPPSEHSNLAEASLCLALESAARESSRRGGQAVPVSTPWTPSS